MHGDLTKKLGEVPEVALREKNENAWEGAKACRSVVETAEIAAVATSSGEDRRDWCFFEQ